MLIYLQADVAKLGKKGSIVEVPDGYARNVLIPKKLGRSVTAHESARILAVRHEAQIAHRQRLTALAEAIERCATAKAPFVLQARANTSGRLYTAIHEKEIAQAVAQTCGVAIPDECGIKLPAPIKETGVHEAVLDIPGVRGVSLNIRVEPISE